MCDITLEKIHSYIKGELDKKEMEDLEKKYYSSPKFRKKWEDLCNKSAFIKKLKSEYNTYDKEMNNILYNLSKKQSLFLDKNEIDNINKKLLKKIENYLSLINSSFSKDLKDLNNKTNVKEISNIINFSILKNNTIVFNKDISLKAAGQIDNKLIPSIKIKGDIFDESKDIYLNIENSIKEKDVIYIGLKGASPNIRENMVILIYFQDGSFKELKGKDIKIGGKWKVKISSTIKSIEVILK